MTATPRPRLSPAEMFNMSFGFLGIQFGWGLQLANMSAVYERLGARSDQVPLLWLAAPVTGLLVQPVIGALSDRTWGPLGRRCRIIWKPRLEDISVDEVVTALFGNSGSDV